MSDDATPVKENRSLAVTIVKGTMLILAAAMGKVMVDYAMGPNDSTKSIHRESPSKAFEKPEGWKKHKFEFYGLWLPPDWNQEKTSNLSTRLSFYARGPLIAETADSTAIVLVAVETISESMTMSKYRALTLSRLSKEQKLRSQPIWTPPVPDDYACESRAVFQIEEDQMRVHSFTRIVLVGRRAAVVSCMVSSEFAKDGEEIANKILDSFSMD